MKALLLLAALTVFLPQAHAQRVILPDGNSLQTVGSGLIIGTDGSSAVVLPNGSTWNDGTRYAAPTPMPADPYVPYQAPALGGYEPVQAEMPSMDLDF